MSLFLIYQENGYCHQYRDSRTKLLPYTNFYLEVFAQIEVLTTFLHTTSTCQMLPALSDVTLPDIKRMVIAININICNIKLHVFCLNLLLKGKVVACNSLFSLKRSPVSRGLIEDVKTNNL